MRRSRRPRHAPPRNTGPRTNEQIRVPRVVVVDENGTRVGEFLTSDALEYAKQSGLDLIEVAPKARPPVCKLGDLGKIKYELKKKRKAAKANASQPTMKELKVRPKTDDHDMSVKSRRARRFLKKGDKVKITVWFRGREHAHHDIGAEQCMRIAEACSDVGEVEMRPQMDGRRMHMVLAPAS